MATVSKNWKFDLNAALGAEIQAMAQGAFNLVAVTAITYIERVYWTVPAAKADDVTKFIHTAMDHLGYNKSSKYELANAGLALARNWMKKYGAAHAVERHAFWNDILAFEDYAPMMTFIVNAIKTDYQADTMKALHGALKGETSTKAKVETSFADKVKKTLDNADTNDASAAAVMATGFLSGQADKLAAMANMVMAMDADTLRKAMNMVNDRMAIIAAAQAAADAAHTAEKELKVA